MPLTVAVDVPPRDREVLESWLRAPSLRAGLVQRARIVLLAADGVPVKDIVERVGVSKPTVIGWKKRYASEGIGGLEDRPKPGRHRVVDEVAVVSATLEPPPERLGVTHWSTRLLGVGDLARVGRQDLATLGPAAVAVRDVQVLHRPRARGQGPRRDRALPQPAR